MRADALAAAVRRYRVMAYVTGVVLMVLCFVGIPLQVFAHNLVVVNYVGTTHGILYMIYLVAAYLMTRQVGLKLIRSRTSGEPPGAMDSWPARWLKWIGARTVVEPATLVVLAAGTIPVLTFVVERWVTRWYINPALAAARAGEAAGPGAAAGGAAAADREPAPRAAAAAAPDTPAPRRTG